MLKIIRIASNTLVYLTKGMHRLKSMELQLTEVFNFITK
jgi:hypothetical protein